MEPTYFVITSGEDGIDIDVFSKDEVEKRLAEQHYGSNVIFLDKMPDINKGHFWLPNRQGEKMPILIVKGEIVVPKAVQRVTEYQVE